MICCLDFVVERMVHFVGEFTYFPDTKTFEKTFQIPVDKCTGAGYIITVNNISNYY